MRKSILTTVTAACLLGTSVPVLAQAGGGTHTIRLLTPEAALKAASGALQDCRKRGFQVAVAVVDRSGVAQVMLRDRFAGAHTPDTATNKAWTAASFRTDTLELARATEAGQPSSGIRHVPRFVGAGGGVMVQAGGTIIGAIGVSGAPTGDMDEACARAGIASIRDDIEF
ncbi:MAG: heme-binding protein [Rhodoferax sp.]|uniref:GlcG/HbpS family heme-binding protein n=1 Tax=Rhodoferax sp. TaxID=50421 RepID=UPI0027158B90|nr:heme-binding protein [Rhodoferax sp.]MDO8449254.1 heme-binding protein [Rhodoferax sp.]